MAQSNGIVHQIVQQSIGRLPYGFDQPAIIRPERTKGRVLSQMQAHAFGIWQCDYCGSFIDRKQHQNCQNCGAN